MINWIIEILADRVDWRKGHNWSNLWDKARNGMNRIKRTKKKRGIDKIVYRVKGKAIREPLTYDMIVTNFLCRNVGRNCKDH